MRTSKAVRAGEFAEAMSSSPASLPTPENPATHLSVPSTYEQFFDESPEKPGSAILSVSPTTAGTDSVNATWMAAAACARGAAATTPFSPTGVSTTPLKTGDRPVLSNNRGRPRIATALLKYT